MSKQHETLKTSRTTWTSPDGVKLDIEFGSTVMSGRPEMTEIRVSTKSKAVLSQSTLRQIPLKRLFDEASRGLHRSAFDLTTGGFNIELKSTHRGTRHRLDDLEALARSYEEVRALRLPLLPTLSKRLGLSPSTINKRLIAARREGLLPSWRLRDGKQEPSPRNRRKNDQSTTHRQGSRPATRRRPHQDS